MSALRNAITKTRRMSIHNILPNIRLIGRRRSSTNKATNDNTDEESDACPLLEQEATQESQPIDIRSPDRDPIEVSSDNRLGNNDIDSQNNTYVAGSMDDMPSSETVPKFSLSRSPWVPSSPSEQQRRNFESRRGVDSVHCGRNPMPDSYDPIVSVRSVPSPVSWYSTGEEDICDETPSRRRSSIARLVGRLLNPRSGRRASDE